ncbi:hypothetical protein BAMA_19755 [Bacillus manliponensis]|uniref:DUF1572 domain-containing protein n=1 Tax=Bacillus manliponensis TaxID=574376 RepID=A0A073K0I2_9BACI|nr:DUF1572 family protein [Bacillus manliponensis]KEK19995.1 hypothetical protein BAMA_19755 [Bacillus manliponensis]
MNVAKAYLQCALENLEEVRKQGDKTLAQVSYEQMCWAPNEETNSIAIIVKHLRGNMRSRWTDFLIADGEKDDRNRDEEFEGSYSSKEEVLKAWDEGWEFVFLAVRALTADDIGKRVYIRGEAHTVMQAIERQVSHYASHIGQMIYIGKMLNDKGWNCLSIPRGQSETFFKSNVQSSNRK